ncbi:hypothetical protein MtrunA17_Chr2g0277791 [Medicago truncatula]|uniref:Uncharacterized protein n=1 Tax=Medicago truncatula TaxID=3880 RepID=A0A396J456_MEDTR|nr:hypothetical protein MtrunA17_Chr2g0277791 [Medicago truncatula]
MKYRKEKARIDEIQRLKLKSEELILSLQEAERRHDIERAASLRYGAIDDVEDAIQLLGDSTDESLMLTETAVLEYKT